jgi:alpha-L-fucosidase
MYGPTWESVRTHPLPDWYADAKNGNLLIGIGPNERGAIPEEQARPLRGLGRWMAANHEAVRSTRRWGIAATETTEGTQVRFTQRRGVVYAILLDLPGQRTFSLRGVDLSGVLEPILLGSDERLDVANEGGNVHITLPERVPVQPAYAIRLGAEVRPLA